MKNNQKNEGLQSRREFFKKAAMGTLPILSAVAMLASPVIVNAAENSLMKTPLGCNRQDCTNSCIQSCRGGCSTACKGCTGRCVGSCQSSCSGGCQRNCGSACEGALPARAAYSHSASVGRR